MPDRNCASCDDHSNTYVLAGVLEIEREQGENKKKQRQTKRKRKTLFTRHPPVGRVIDLKTQ